jgi:hypothetical protein
LFKKAVFWTNFWQMKSFIVLFCLVSVWLPLDALFAQNQSIVDSLRSIYQKKTHHDTVRIQALIDLAYQYNAQPDTCFALAQKALEQSEALGFQRGCASIKLLETKALKRLPTTALAWYISKQKILSYPSDILNKASALNASWVINTASGLYSIIWAWPIKT